MSGTAYYIKDKKILLYGAASMGVKYYEVISKLYYNNFIGFVDKRAEEISYLCGYKVYSVEELASFSDKDQYVIIIDVKNVFEHSEIAYRLLHIGYSNIVFRPWNVLQGNGKKYEKEINRIYDQILLENYKRKICSVREVLTPEIEDFAYIDSEADGMVIARLPFCLVYSDNDKISKEGWSNCSIYSFFAHIDFFEIANGVRIGDFQNYLDFCIKAARGKNILITENWEKNVIKNRLEVYESMQRAFSCEPDFFVRNAVPVERNPKGYFNLCSGKHRTTFLISKGYTVSPFRIKIKDYDYLINKNVLNKVKMYFSSHGCFRLQAPIEHPFFLRYPCLNETFFYKIIKVGMSFFARWLLRKYGSVNSRGKIVYLNIEDGGFLKRFFWRQGVHVITDQPLSEYELMLNDLFHIVVPCDSEAISDSYDFSIIYVKSENEFANQINRRVRESKLILYISNELDISVKGMKKITNAVYNNKLVSINVLERD